MLFRVARWFLIGGLVFGLLSGCERGPLVNDLKAAREAMLQGDWTTAEKYLERYLRTTEDVDHRWEAWKELLDVAEHSKMGTDWTVEYLETMLAEFGDDPGRARRVLRRLAETYEKARSAERAAHYWAMLIDEPGLPPEENQQAHRHLAALYFQLRRFDAAEDVLQSSFALPVSESLQAECLYDLADQMATRELQDEAERLARQVLQMDAADVLKGRAGFIVADIQEQRGNLTEALTSFEAISDLYPNRLVIENRMNSLKKRIRK